MIETDRDSQLRVELVDVARALLAGDMNIVEGVKRISRLQHELNGEVDPNAPPYQPINSRDHGGPQRPQLLDEAMNAQLRVAAPDVLASCERIVRNYSN